MSAELEKAKINLEKAEKLQDIMKKANAILRSGKDVTNKLVEIGMSQDQAVKIQQPDFANRIGFAQYQLTNNNATIKRLKDRVNQLESKETAAKAGEERYLFQGGSVEVNYSADRVQILFDEIPSAEKRTELKKNGWKWSPTNSAWQRMITPQAISNAKHLTGATGAAPVKEQTGPIDTDELLNKRKFSYVTINLYGALPADYTGSKSFELVYFDVISANIVEAIRAYFKENLPEIESDKVKVSVYAKTYVKESQRLVDQNRYLPNEAPAKIVLGPGLQQVKDFFGKQQAPSPQEVVRSPLFFHFSNESSGKRFHAEAVKLVGGSKFSIEKGDFKSYKAGATDKYFPGDNKTGNALEELYTSFEHDTEPAIVIQEESPELDQQETEQDRLRKIRNEREAENARIANEKINVSELTEGEVFLHATSKGGKYDAKLIYRAPEFYDIVATGTGGGGKLSQVMNTIRYWKEEYPVVLIDKFDLLGTGAKSKADSEQYLHDKAENKKYSSQADLIKAFEQNSPEDQAIADKYHELYEDISKLFSSGVVSAKRYFIENGAQPLLTSVSAASSKDQYRKALIKFTESGREIMTNYIDQTDKAARQLIGQELFSKLKKKYGSPKANEESKDEIEVGDRVALYNRDGREYDVLKVEGSECQIKPVTFDNKFDTVAEGKQWASKEYLFLILKGKQLEISRLKWQIKDKQEKLSEAPNSGFAEAWKKTIHESTEKLRELGESYPEPKPAAEEVFEPNTGDEFDEMIISNLQPHDGWVGNIIKERIVKKQIYDQLTGPESEKDAAVSRIFEKYKADILAKPVAEEKKEEGLFDYLPAMNHLDDVERNVDAIAIEYADRPMAALQVISYLTKNVNPYVNSFMRKHRLETKEKMVEYVGKRQTILRAGKGKERSEFLKSQKEQTAAGHVDAIFAMAMEQSAEMDEKIKQHDSSDSKVLERYPKLSKTEIVKVYNEVEAILGKEQYTAEDKYILEKYEGLGSQTATGIIDKGLLHQFYTPYIIAKKMWELGFIYGVRKENPIVIEPSMGTGRFFKYAPAGSTCIGFDPDKKNVEIAKILYPDITVYQQEFETAFLEAPRYNRMAKKSWLPAADLCIGNPPYGDYMGYYKSYMPSAFKRFEFLFIYLGLKTLKPGGLLVFIVSQNFMNNGAMYNGMKAKILELGEFVDSIRLPNGIFSSTDVGTDIVIFRKK